MPRNTANLNDAERQEHERRRDAYIRQLRENTRTIGERVRRAERLTADDLAVQINATDF